MTSRRDELLDAAIEVLGSGGSRRLTHRAVDQQARLPDGSTSNLFRTRSALLVGVLEHLLAREMAAWARCLTDEAAQDADSFAAAVATLLEELSGTSATLTRARHALFAEAATDAELSERVAAQRVELEGVTAAWLGDLGADEGSHHGFLALVEGLLWHRTTLPAPSWDARGPIDAYLRGCVPDAGQAAQVGEPSSLPDAQGNARVTGPTQAARVGAVGGGHVVDIQIEDEVGQDDLVALYDAVEWGAYTRSPDTLVAAIANSSIVVTARDEHGALVGLARGLSDDASVFYLQDILVHPDHQRSGVGRRLLTVCLERYGHVRQKVLLTDDDEAQRRFYESLGYVRTNDVAEATLNAYVRFDA